MSQVEPLLIAVPSRSVGATPQEPGLLALKSRYEPEVTTCVENVVPVPT